VLFGFLTAVIAVEDSFVRSDLPVDPWFYISKEPNDFYKPSIVLLRRNMS